MKVLKATNTQANNLSGEYLNGAILRFAKDANGNNIVGLEVLTDDDFIEIREQLQALKQIDYIRPLDN